MTGCRVGMVISAPMRAGAERQALKVAHGLIGDGYVVDVVAVEDGDEDVIDEFRTGGARVTVFDAAVADWRDRPWLIPRLAAHLRNARVDVVVPFCRLPNIAAAFAWRAGGARGCVWNQRDAGLGLDGRASQRLAVAAASRIACNSMHAVEMMAKEFLIERRNIHYVPNISEPGVPRFGRAVWRARLGVAADAPLAVLVSNITRSKAVDLALSAWAEVARLRHDAVLVVAGARGDATGEAERAVVEHGIRDSVRFAGRVIDVAGLIDAADIGFFAARSEGTPGFLLELGQAAKPWVAIDIAGVREVLPFGLEDRLAVDAAGLGEAAVRLFAENASVRAREGELHRAHIREHFSAARGLAAWRVLLDGMLGG